MIGDSTGKYRSSNRARYKELIVGILVAASVVVSLRAGWSLFNGISSVSSLHEEVQEIRDDVAEFTRLHRWDQTKVNKFRNRLNAIDGSENKDIQSLQSQVAELEREFHILKLNTNPIVKTDVEPEVNVGVKFADQMRYVRENMMSSDLHRCEWIQKLLDGDEALGPRLRKSGIDREVKNKNPFWLKAPLLHTRNPETSEDIMILKYNYYPGTGTQRTLKFNNTVKVLLSHQELIRLTGIPSRIFPKLHGFCNTMTIKGDVKPTHVLAVEFIDHDLQDLPKPSNFQECADRATKALDLFAEMDEHLHLTLVDFKPGQWMARSDGTLVLQDVDDIVEPGDISPYPDQQSYLINRLAAANRRPVKEVKDIYFSKMFPDQRLTIRYSSASMSSLLDDLGFKWGRDCQGTPTGFNHCLDLLRKWFQTLEEDWPTPLQIKNAFVSCSSNQYFNRTARVPAPWRDLTL